MMTHRLHIEDEGYEGGSLGGSKHVVRAYCECGWLGTIDGQYYKNVASSIT